MTGGSLIFWGILIFIGLTFDQYNSKKKRNKKVIAYKL
ncbi:flagellar motor protein [Bacillus mycoides]